MAFLQPYQLKQVTDRLTQDASTLGRLYSSKKKNYMELSIDHNLVDVYIKDGWEVFTTLKTKTKIKKRKSVAKEFEDNIWCQLYEIGYRNLNFDENLHLPYGKEDYEKKQIDVVAIDGETAILVECKSAINPSSAPSYKTEFEGLSLKLDGFKKTINQLYGSEIKIKYIFATKNILLSDKSEDYKRLMDTNSFHYDDNAFKYVENLILNYKYAVKYQFLGLIFKNQLINNTKIEIPAIEGDMGNKKYYMFSIEPSLLLKIGYILHKTKTNAELPNYQRLLVPSRLVSITQYIDKGGCFPNSLIVNFNESKHEVNFESVARKDGTSSRYGTLKIPNAYALAYIIDGQHRLYGYAGSKYLNTNTVPVVAFKNLSPEEQLHIFVDINENQKAVKPSLRTMLKEDLLWSSTRVDSRMSALRSAIIRELSENLTSPLYAKIEIGADPAPLSADFFDRGILASGLLPKAKGNTYIEDSLEGSIYNTNNLDHSNEMQKTKKEIVELVSLCYSLVINNYSEYLQQGKILH